MEGHVQKKGLDKGYNFIYVAPNILGGNMNKFSFTFYNRNCLYLGSTDYPTFFSKVASFKTSFNTMPRCKMT